MLFDNWRVVDLSLTLSEAYQPTWPGDVRFQTHVSAWFAPSELGGVPVPASGSHQTHAVHMSDHTGTHCDAPSHFIPPPDSGLPHAGPKGRVTVDQLSVTLFMGPARVIDTRPLLGRDPAAAVVTAAVVEAYERETGTLEPGDVVLLCSGWDERYRQGRGYYGPLDHPADDLTWNTPAVDAIQLLVKRQVRAVGTDAPSLGPAADPSAVHLAALGAGLGVVEGLAHLGQVPARGAEFLFLPVKLGGGSGGPGRAIAFLPPE